MPRRRDESSTIALIIAMLLGSGLFHLVLWPLGDRVLKWQWPASDLPSSDGFMEVTLLEPPEDIDPELEKLLDGEGKLVQQDRRLNEERPDDTEHLAEFDQKVEREQRAPNRRKQPGDRPQVPGQDSDANQPSKRPGKAVHPSPSRDPSQSSGAQDEGDGEQTPNQADAANDGSLPKKPGASGGDLRGLRGTTQDMHKVFGTPGSFDNLRELDEGDENILNSRRWKYASFFNRVRNSIAQHWDPVSVHKTHDPMGSRWGTATRFTQLAITLNPEGALVRVRVAKPCGVLILDEEAIRAVRSAAPFVNPPRQLVDKNSGNIEFLFGFIFELDGKPRIFRIKR